MQKKKKIYLSFLFFNEVVQEHKNPNSSYNYIIIKNTHRISRSGARVIEDRRHIL